MLLRNDDQHRYCEVSWPLGDCCPAQSYAVADRQRREGCMRYANLDGCRGKATERGANKKLCQHAAQLGKAAYRAVFKAMEDGEFDTIEQADECDDGLFAQYKRRYGGRK